MIWDQSLGQQRKGDTDMKAELIWDQSLCQQLKGDTDMNAFSLALGVFPVLTLKGPLYSTNLQQEMMPYALCFVKGHIEGRQSFLSMKELAAYLCYWDSLFPGSYIPRGTNPAGFTFKFSVNSGGLRGSVTVKIAVFLLVCLISGYFTSYFDCR